MKKLSAYLYLFTALLLFSNMLFSEALVITERGKSFWIESGSKKDGQLVYQAQGQKEKKKISLESVFHIIPAYKRGKKCNSETADKIIRLIEEVRRKFPKLKKQVNPLYSDWKALKKSTEGLQKKINRSVANYRKSERKREEYSKAHFKLNMIKYKDLQGEYTKKIDSAIKEIKDDFTNKNIRQLKRQEKIKSIKEFSEAERAFENINLAKLDSKRKQNAKHILSKIRLRVLNYNFKKAEYVFSKHKTLDSYLAANGILYDLNTKVAAEKHIPKINNRLNKYLQMAKSMFGSYNFEFNGFPLNRRDMQLLNSHGKYSSTIKFSTIDADQQYFFFPVQDCILKLKSKFNIKFRIVFNRKPDTSKQLFMAVKVIGSNGRSVDELIPVNDLKPENGHTEVRIQHKFKNIPDDFSPTVSEKTGKAYAYLWLVRKENKDAKDQKAVSHVAALPISDL